MNIQVIFSFWLLWIMFLWTFMYKFFCGLVFSFILEVCVCVYVYICMYVFVSPCIYAVPSSKACLTYWRIARLFSSVAARECSIISPVLSTHVIFRHLTLTILVGVKCGVNLLFPADWCWVSCVCFSHICIFLDKYLFRCFVQF